MNTEITTKRLRQIARAQLIGRYGIAIPAVLIIAGIQIFALMLAESGSDGTVTAYLFRYVISIIIDLLTGILLYGRSVFFLKVARCDEEISIKDMFMSLKYNMDKAILVQIPFTFLAVVCTMPVVLMNLGIIAPFYGGYSMSLLIMNGVQIVLLLIAKLYLGLSFLVLADEPELSAPDVWVRSAELMHNRKGRLIIVCLSVLPLLIVAALGLVIGLLWFECYFRTLMADFYLDAKGSELVTSPVKPQHDPSDYTT